MKQNKIAMKTMAIKARVYNFIRKSLYNQYLENISEKTKIELFDKIFGLNKEAHWELIRYKQKRQDKSELLKQRLAAPQTKSMEKKLGLIPKVKKINLVNSEK